MIAVLIAALAGLAAAPLVVAADPTAPFKGDGTALRFDPACRDYTVATVGTDPACAARVAKGEAAPSIAIAIRTLTQAPLQASAAVAILEHSATVSDNPAAHAMLGSVLGTAERVKPNYPEAVRHLNIAAGRGNPDAADLLATLVVAGKGTVRDMPRAIKLYEQAAANGFPNAALTLGKLYLAGRYVPKDVTRGRAWLDAAGTVGVAGASQLAALAANDAKINNIQLIPAADANAVRTIRYGTFDNPDIPPNFGFDLSFQELHDAPYDDRPTLARLESGMTTMPTPYLYELARRIAASEPERALTTYLLARTRMIYDASRCADPAAFEAIRAWDMLVGSDIRFLFASGRPTPAAIASALEAEAKLPANTTPWWVCRSGMAAMTAALSGKPGVLQLKSAGEWPALREAARTSLTAMAAR